MLKSINCYKDGKRTLTHAPITFIVSNAQYKKFPASSLMVGYTGQVSWTALLSNLKWAMIKQSYKTKKSLLVIIVAIIQISVTTLVSRNLGYVLSNSTWKVSGACIIFSLASVCFRTLTSWFIQDPKSFYCKL